MSNAESVVALHVGEIEQIRAAVAMADSRDAIFRAIEAIAVQRIEPSVFSASTFVAESMELERVYSSRPEIYAQGGRKNKRETRWGQLVLKERQVFVGEGSFEMAAAFDDQERMESLGIRSIINVPVVVRNRCIGVLAFGRSADRVRPSDVVIARLLGLASTPAFAV